MEVFGIHIPFTNVQDASKQMPEQSDVRRFISKPQQQVYRIRQDIQKWRNAVTVAESLINPNRYQLYQLYKDIVLDAHLSAAIQQRKNLTLSKTFCVVDKAGNEVEEKSKLIQTKWFREFLEHSLDSEYYGYSLVQFDSLVDDNFNDVDLVPRIYVKPEFNLVVPTWAAIEGINYTESPYKEWCIGVGKKHNLGLLMKAAPLVLWKKNAIGAWSVYQDAYGVPLAIGKTNSRDEVTRANLENTLKTISTGLSAVMDIDDTIEFLESKKPDAHMVFDAMINRCNSEISKLILGQTATMDEKSFVGSAEVQERVLIRVGEADEFFALNVINEQLLPMLNGLGFGLDGYKIQAKEDDDLPLMDRMKIDTELMKYYDLDEKYILETYGTVVTKKAVVDTGFSNFKNKLNELYK